MLLFENPNAPDWAICWQMLWEILILPLTPPLAAAPLSPLVALPPLAPPVAAAADWVALCEALLLVSNSATALCVAANPLKPIAVAETITSAEIAKDVLFICIRILYRNNDTINFVE
jgi:hypothetical protein